MAWDDVAVVDVDLFEHGGVEELAGPVAAAPVDGGTTRREPEGEFHHVLPVVEARRFDGIYYTARHGPAFLERSIAVFGTPSTAKLFTLSTGPVPAGLVDEVARDFGLTVLPL